MKLALLPSVLLLCAACAPQSPPPDPIPWITIDNVAIAEQGHLYASGFTSDEDTLRQFALWDGRAWRELGTGFPTSGNSMAVDSRGHLYTEIIAESSQGSATAIMRWDGDGWQDITGDFSTVVDALKPGRLSSNTPVTALAVDAEDNLYAGGMYYYPSPDQTAELPMGYVARWNGDGWTVLGEGFDKVNIFALAAGVSGEVYVSGEQPMTAEGVSGYVAEWNGAGWTQTDTGNSDVSLHIALDHSGGFYAAGQRNAGGAFIGHWDRTHWTTTADRFAGEAPAIFAMAVNAIGNLCIGGSFDAVNGTPARNIACWDGVLWHALAGGVNERVLGLAFDKKGDLYAVGYFTEAGGMRAHHIARWDGAEWHTFE